jgi:hypothetical protein
MDNAKSSRHTKWECKVHVVWIPKHRRKCCTGLRRYLGEVPWVRGSALLAGARGSSALPAFVSARRTYGVQIPSGPEFETVG